MTTLRQAADTAGFAGDKTLYGMDGVTALGFCFQQEVPKGIQWALGLPMGRRFVDWLIDGNGLPVLYDHLSATYNEHFRGRKRSDLSWEQFASFVALMSNRRWQPSAAYCEDLCARQRAEGGRDHAVVDPEAAA